MNPWYYSDAPKTVRPMLEIARRTSTFDEVVSGLDETNALFEARRCLSCGNCFECDNCYGVCPDNAVIKLGPGKRFEFNFDYCKGCGICVSECPCGAIKMVPESELRTGARPPGPAARTAIETSMGGMQCCRKVTVRQRQTRLRRCRRRRAAAGSGAEQGHRVHRSGARRLAPARAPATARRRRRNSRSPRLLESFRAQADRPRQVHQPALGARPQRGALLPPAGRSIPTR